MHPHALLLFWRPENTGESTLCCRHPACTAATWRYQEAQEGSKEGSAKSKHGWNLACTDKEGHLGATPRWKAGSCKTVSGLCILSLLRLMHRLLFHLPRYEIHSQSCTLYSGMTEGDKHGSETLDW